jgi:predicted Zn-dependent protease
MNIEKIKTILNRTTGVSDWLLRQVETDVTTIIRLPNIVTVENGRFVRTANPHPREVIRAPGEEVWVTVYSRFMQAGQEYMGETIGQLVTDEESAVEPVLAGLVTAARSQPNQPFTLPDRTTVYPQVALADQALMAASSAEVLRRAQDFNDRTLAESEQETSIEVSNLEVFLRRSLTRFQTSAGISLEFDATRIDAEVCFIARLDHKVGEHTAGLHVRRLADLNPAEFVREYAEFARAVARAGTPPIHTGAVVATGDAVRDMMKFAHGPLALHCSARSLYDKMSNYQKGKPVSGDAPLKGDLVTLASDPLIPFGPNSTPLATSDASPARKVTLVAAGNYEELYGHRKFFEYLGLTAQGVVPPGQLGNTVVEAGRWPAQELLNTGRVVVIRAFSDFSADANSGDFACEIRLGEVRENGQAAPFKGGLLIGNYFAALADIALSSDLTAADGYYGPAAIRFNNLQIAG